MPDGPSVATPATFTITTASTTAKLDANRKGQVAFTVTNASSQPLKGRGRVVPLGNAKAEWFAIDGDAERPFAAGGTQQYTVRINVPASVAPGRYAFQHKETGVANPDELYGEGPQVAFEVLKPPVKATPIPWMWIIIAIVVLLVLIGGGLLAFILLSGKPKGVLDKPTLTFSADVAATSVAQTETLSNTGNADLVLQDVSIDGPAKADYKLATNNCSGKTLKPSGGCTVDVTFTPPTVGARTASLNFANTANQSLTVALSGTGTVSRPGLYAGTWLPDTSLAGGVTQMIVTENSGVLFLHFVCPVSLTGPSATCSYAENVRFTGEPVTFPNQGIFAVQLQLDQTASHMSGTVLSNGQVLLTIGFHRRILILLPPVLLPPQILVSPST